MRRTLAGLLALTLMLGGLSTAASALDLQTIQNAPLSLTNVFEIEYYSDGTPSYACQDTTTITITEDLSWIDCYYWDCTAEDWVYLGFKYVYTSDYPEDYTQVDFPSYLPFFDTSNTTVSLTDSCETCSLVDYLDNVRDDVLSADTAHTLAAGSSFDVLVPLSYALDIYYLDGTHSYCYLDIFEGEAADSFLEDHHLSGTATPSTSAILVNGQAISFDAYVIENSNYFKLRDLAAAFSGSEKQFEVTYDNDLRAIDMISGQCYTALGGELSAGDGTAKAYTPSTFHIYLDGEMVALQAYIIDDNTYYNLRDICAALDIGVTWNQDTQTVDIDTTASYQAQ